MIKIIQVNVVDTIVPDKNLEDFTLEIENEKLLVYIKKNIVVKKILNPFRRFRENHIFKNQETIVTVRNIVVFNRGSNN